MTVRSLPPPQCVALRDLFNHYVFEGNGDPAVHLLKASLGVRRLVVPTLARRIRDFLAAGLPRP